MLQKSEEIRQQRFIRSVQELGLRFPNKEIVKRTGYNSGIVSEYLNSKKNVSEKFLREFCKAFNIDYDEKIISPFTTADPMNFERSKIIALEKEVAMLKSMLFEVMGRKRSYEECLDDIERASIEALTDLRRSKTQV